MGVNGNDSSAYALRSSVAAWLCNETSWKQENSSELSARPLFLSGRCDLAAARLSVYTATRSVRPGAAARCSRVHVSMQRSDWQQ